LENLALPFVSQLNQPNYLTLAFHGHQDHSFVAISVAYIARGTLLLSWCCDQQLTGAVGNKRAAIRVKRSDKICFLFNNVDTHAAVTIDGQGAFTFIELTTEAGIGGIRDIAILVQESDSNSLATGVFLYMFYQLF
jgi:hypothetical protein